MIEVNELSNIGFGGHRISLSQKENEIALRSALKKGCNLIDTSSNYKDGESEKLIGKVLSEGNKAFVITKAGYITDSNLLNFNKYQNNKIETVNISDSFKFSIHPDFLNVQLEKSLKRLKKTSIDCFLLHNPEFSFRDQNMSEDKYYKRIKKAFEYLEYMVSEKKIRYYGISSYFNFPYDKQSITRLDRVIEISNEVSTKNHFKFIQYPHNISEKKGLDCFYPNEESLFSLSKKNGIITMGNRPFTVKNSNGTNLKLLSKNKKIIKEKDIDKNIFDLFQEMQKQLSFMKRDERIENFEVVYQLKDMWRKLRRIIDVKKIFSSVIYSFMELIYTDGIKEKVLLLYNKTLNSICDYINYQEYLLTKSYLINNFPKLANVSSSNLPKYLLDQYLKVDGIDHMLVGMTKPKYVNDLKFYWNNI